MTAGAATPAAPANPDPRRNAWRADLADERLRGIVAAPRYAAGRPARIVAGRAALRGLSAADSETLTFCHYGEEVLVFDEAGGHAWCQSRFDCYVGYVERRHIAFGPAPPPTHFVATLGSYLYAAPDLRSTASDFLPRHSPVAVAGSAVTRGTRYAQLDTGGFVPLACLAQAPPRSPDIVAAAALYLGCPYLWGGRSFLGIDCSGLVQSAFRDLGAVVPRDTDMQRDAIGTAVPIGREAELRPGDLLYMPGHVMIHAGGGAVVHADGVRMAVRRDALAELMRARGLDFASFVVRRP